MRIVVLCSVDAQSQNLTREIAITRTDSTNLLIRNRHLVRGPFLQWSDQSFETERSHRGYRRLSP
jgi:hypothetical protein